MRGFVCRSDRSASRISSACRGPHAASMVAGPERRLDERREVLDVGTHHDHVAELEVGSSSSRWRMASRRTSTCRARPWHECTRMLSSAASSRGRCSARRGGGAAGPVGPHVVLDALQQRRRRRNGRGLDDRVPLRHRAPAASRERRDPKKRGVGCAPAAGGRVLGRGRTSRDARRPGPPRDPTTPATGARRRGGRRARRRSPRGHRGSWPAAGSGRTATAARAGRATLSPCATSGTPRAGARPDSAPDPVSQTQPELDLPRGLAELRSPLGPPLQHVRAVDGVPVEEVGHVPDAREALRPLNGPRLADVLRQRRQPPLVEVRLHHFHQRPHGALGRPGVGVGVDVRGRGQRAVHQRAGKGKSTLAHTPSCRPCRAPRCPARRCVSQRSMPRVGTETTSASIGSERIGHQAGQLRDQVVGAVGAVDVQHPRRVGRRCSPRLRPSCAGVSTGETRDSTRQTLRAEVPVVPLRQRQDVLRAAGDLVVGLGS